jgi:IclR family transcriptional regulator, mhp operon transcriptional activator
MRTRQPNHTRGSARPSAPAPPTEVLLRGLSVIEALNRRPVSTIEQLADATRLPKPTVVRVLNQLVATSYVERLPKRRGYMLGERVLTLSAGYHSQDAVVREAHTILAAFTTAHKWPVSLATLDTDTMRVRASTSQESPFATPGDQQRIARRVPILASAHGRAYLAFCPGGEYEIIVALLQVSTRKDDLPARDARFLSNLLKTTRRAGYAISAPLAGDPAIGLAVPVFRGPRVLASLSLRYLGKAISEAEVARRYLEPLRGAARAIAEAAPR